MSLVDRHCSLGSQLLRLRTCAPDTRIWAHDKKNTDTGVIGGTAVPTAVATVIATVGTAVSGCLFYKKNSLGIHPGTVPGS